MDKIMDMAKYADLQIICIPKTITIIMKFKYTVKVNCFEIQQA